MREVMEQILDGTYDYEKGTLSFSCTKLEIELQKGEVYEGSFMIYASEGKYTTGYVYASDPRMECLSTEIHGNREEIAFCFHGEWMEEGEVTRGEFQIVSNKGEYYLPYVVSVRHSLPQSGMGAVKNLLYFSNLAKSNWQEAVNVFYTPQFGRMVQDNNEQLYLYYQGLSNQNGNEQHVEEFLIAAEKKQRIEYIVSEKKLTFSNVSGIVEQSINVFRNGWGYTRLEVWCEGEFLFVEKNVITEDDFLGNRYTLSLYIDASLLHQGKNIGKVILRSFGSDVEIPIIISQKSGDATSAVRTGEKRKNICRLMQSFQNYRLKKMCKTDWIQETTQIVDRMVAQDEKDITARLFQAHLLITKEQYNEAGWILEHAGDLMDRAYNPEIEAYYLYLNTLYRREDGYTGEMGWQVTKIYREDGEGWKVAWLLLFLVDEYKRNPASKWSFLSRQFENGCTSPLIYLEAFLLVNSNPTLLRRLGAFELQVLNYGRKKGTIHPELMEQVLYLAERVKEYHPLLYTFFVENYKKNQDTRVLKEICTLLIKGNRLGNGAFEWFLKGVSEGLRITNLYEYYMLSMDLKEEPDIPKQVLIYFTYQTNLDYLHNAYLFYYVTKRARVFQDIYNNYCPRMEMFVEEQITKGHINKHLAYLYQNFMKEKWVDERKAQYLAKLLFAHEIQLENKDIRNVIVIQPNHLKEQVYPVSGDKVWIPLYGKEYGILFENHKGIRLVKDVPYTMEKLLSINNMVENIAVYVEDNPSFDIYLYNRNSSKISIKEDDIKRWKRLAEYEYLSKTLKAEIQLQILKYYYGEKATEELAEYLEEVDGDVMTAVQRGEVIRLMVLCQCMDQAYEWLVHYENCKIPENIVLHLLEDRVRKSNHLNDRNLTLYCYKLLRKDKFTEEILQYMMHHFHGLTRDMRNIWKACGNYQIDRNAFGEKILIQMMFSGYYVGEQADIFREYVLSNANERIVDAYLIRHCHEFFIHDSLMQEGVLVEIGRLHSIGHPIPEMCRLAYLKYYADKQEEILEDEVFVIRDFMDAMIQNKIHLNCISELRRYGFDPMQLMDKTIVEYRTSMDAQPIIRYVIIRENEEVGEYMEEPMEHILEGVFIKEFVLFFGESLQYYVVEERDGEEKLTQSATIQKEELQGEDLPGRYGMINDIVISKTMQDYDTFDNLLAEYYKKDFYNQELFKLR